MQQKERDAQQPFVGAHGANNGFGTKPLLIVAGLMVLGGLGVLSSRAQTIVHPAPLGDHPNTQRVLTKRSANYDEGPPPPPPAVESAVAKASTTGASKKSAPPQSPLSVPSVSTNNGYAPVTGTSNEWSFDVLERQYKADLALQQYPKGDVAKDPSILFVDGGRDECEASRGFLISVRQSGFLGHVVYMAYYKEDEEKCKHLEEEFAPLEIFYRPTPKWELTLVQYHGVVNYFQANPDTLTRYQKAAVVKPDDVTWCKNPFNDVPLPPADDAQWSHPHYKRPPTNRTIFAVVGHQTDVHPDNYEFFSRPNPWDTNYTNLEMKGNKRIIDHFIAGTPYALHAYMQLMSTFALQREFWYTKGSFNIVNEFDEVKLYAKAHTMQLEPRSRYESANCYYYLPPNKAESCMNCAKGTHNLVVGTLRCMRKVTYIEPHYTPFCKQPFRHAIMEVPSDLKMEGAAYDRVLEGAHRIRDGVGPLGINKIFTEKPDKMLTVSDQCPNGVLGVLTMMSGYKIDMVERFIGSFLEFGDAKCTKMIMLIGPHDGLEGLRDLYPDRIEHVMLDDTTEYQAQTLKDCKAPADKRFEIVQRWLDKNYQRFKYIMATDSRDYLFLADPLAQLVKILNAQGYLGKDFVASVAETFTAGGATHPHHLASYFMTEWVKSCGPLCYRKMAKMEFTNGDPFALLNSGHMIGTSIAMLHYFRFHVRMIIESGHQCDGTDQGLMTYFFYGMLQEAKYPHKVFVFSTSRSGFGNMPAPHRMSKRELNGEWEYTITDCNNNVYAGIHQFDRYQEDFWLLAGNAPVSRPWEGLRKNGTFDEFFKPRR